MVNCGTTGYTVFTRLDCPKCRASLHYSSGWDEQLCLKCGWMHGEPGCNNNYAPAYLYELSEYCTILGMLFKQYKAGHMTFFDYYNITEEMDIKR
jgi:hypothetical protein